MPLEQPAACFLRLDALDHDTRAWCHLEVLLPRAHSFDDHQIMIVALTLDEGQTALWRHNPS